MVSRDELRKKYKIKILLKGNTGTGKSYTAVKISEMIARKGWKVLYLDRERGSQEELLKLDDKTLENIIHEDFKNYKMLKDAIKKHTVEQGDKLKLIVVDPIPLVELTRLSARDAYLDQGYYYLGEKKVDIDNKETFDLRGFMYQLSTTYQQEFLDTIVSCGQDVVCCLMTPNKHENDYDGKFSIIFETFSAWVGNKIFYKAIPKKVRGVDLNAMPAIDDPWKKLLEAFAKKYGNIKIEDVLAEEAKREEEIKKADEKKKEEDAKRAEELKKADEMKKQEEVKKATELKF